MIRPSSSFFALSLLSVLSAPLVGCGGATSDDTAQTQPGAAGSAGSGLGGSGQGGDAGAGGAAAGAGGSAGGGAGAGGGEAGAGGAVTGGAGGGSAGTGGAAAGAGGFQTAPHANAPTMPYHGGPLLKAPQLVTITFPGYPHKDKVESFGDFVVTSKWLDAVGGEYGIGAGAHIAKVVMADAAPTTIDDKAVQTWLKSKIADGTLPTPADAKNDYLYMIYYPQSTTITLQGDKSCQGFLGYHSGYTSNGVNFSYAVMPACSQAVTGMNQLASIIFSASHELIEAATDALPLSKPGYSNEDYMSPWTFMGSEVGDVCIDLGFTEGGFTMQRSWSNAAAKEGKDPCVPAPSDIMFNVSAEPSGTQVVKAGDTITYTLTGWSSEQIAAWQLEAYTYQGNFDPKPKLSATKINNAEQVTLTLTIPSNVQKQSLASVAIFSAKSQTDYHIWPVAVYVQLASRSGGSPSRGDPVAAPE